MESLEHPTYENSEAFTWKDPSISSAASLFIFSLDLLSPANFARALHALACMTGDSSTKSTTILWDRSLLCFFVPAVSLLPHHEVIRLGLLESSGFRVLSHAFVMAVSPSSCESHQNSHPSGVRARKWSFHSWSSGTTSSTVRVMACCTYLYSSVEIRVVGMWLSVMCESKIQKHYVRTQDNSRKMCSTRKRTQLKGCLVF